MFISLFQVFNFAIENVVWLLFVAIVLWIVFAPQLNKFMKSGSKSQSYFVE